MYKHLVVAVDGSEISVNALRHACSVAAAGKAKLTLVHVANPAEYMALVFLAQLLINGRAGFQLFLNSLTERHITPECWFHA